MSKYVVGRSVFSPCANCAGGEVISESGSGVKTDFGIALKELERRGNSYDDSGRQVPVSPDDVVEVARACDLIDESGDFSPQLAACYEAQQNGECVLGEPTEVKITSDIL